MPLIDGTLSALAPIFAAALLAGPRAALFLGLATASLVQVALGGALIVGVGLFLGRV
ncbi:hypothetical protein [Pseudonocardia sp. T1-2H]|uniref:hypothetical protein n=1 Tax=Pseudonocardia sp. T1-2H TaxID=3128899 RepID=UPI003100E502